MIAATAAVAVEISLLHAVLNEVRSRRNALLERARRTNVIGGDRVADHQQRAGIHHVADAARVHVEILEKWRLGDVRGLWPGVDLSGRRGDRIPQIMIACEVAV